MKTVSIEKKLFVIGKYISLVFAIMITLVSFIPRDFEIHKVIDFITIAIASIFFAYIPIGFAILLYFMLRRRGIISKKNRDILILYTENNNKERLYLTLIGFAFIALSLLIILYDTSYVFFHSFFFIRSPDNSNRSFSFAETITVNKGIITFDQRNEALSPNELEFVEIDGQSFKAVTSSVEHEFDFNNKQSKILHFWWNHHIKTINTKS